MTDNDTIFAQVEGLAYFNNYLGNHRESASKEYHLTDFEKKRLKIFKKEMQQSSIRKFSFLMDLVGDGFGPKIRFPIGAENLFEHPERLNLSYFFASVHPQYLQVFRWWGGASYQLSLLPQVKPLLQEGYQLKYVFTVPLCKNLDVPASRRKYEWWQQKAEIVRLAPNKRILTHLNRYTYFNTFQNGLHSGAIFSDIEHQDEGDRMLLELLKQQLLPVLYNRLRANESRILKAYVNGCQSISEVSQATQYTEKTVRTYSNRLLKRINPPYPLFPFREFTTLKKAVEHLKKIIQ
jgi:hypothetical protein